MATERYTMLAEFKSGRESVIEFPSREQAYAAASVLMATTPISGLVAVHCMPSLWYDRGDLPPGSRVAKRR